MAKLNKEDFIAALNEMTILEIKELVDAMKDEFGIDPTQVAVAAPGASEGAAEDENAKVNVALKEIGGNKIAVIKVVREITGLGLKDAKDIVDSCGIVKEAVAKADAEELKAKLEEAGATIELQ